MLSVTKRLVAKRRLSWRRIYAGVACGACSFAVAKTWNSAGSAFRHLLVLRAPCSSFQIIISRCLDARTGEAALVQPAQAWTRPGSRAVTVAVRRSEAKRTLLPGPNRSCSRWLSWGRPARQADNKTFHLEKRRTRTRNSNVRRTRINIPTTSVSPRSEYRLTATAVWLVLCFMKDQFGVRGDASSLGKLWGRDPVYSNGDHHGPWLRVSPICPGQACEGNSSTGTNAHCKGRCRQVLRGMWRKPLD